MLPSVSSQPMTFHMEKKYVNSRPTLYITIKSISGKDVRKQRPTINLVTFSVQTLSNGFIKK